MPVLRITWRTASCWQLLGVRLQWQSTKVGRQLSILLAHSPSTALLQGSMQMPWNPPALQYNGMCEPLESCSPPSMMGSTQEHPMSLGQVKVNQLSWHIPHTKGTCCVPVCSTHSSTCCGGSPCFLDDPREDSATSQQIPDTNMRPEMLLQKYYKNTGKARAEALMDLMVCQLAS